MAFFQRWREYLGELYRGFASALPGLARAFPDHHFVVRPHPSEDHEAWRRETHGLENVTVAFDGSVIPWIAGADALVHNSCTTGVEAYLLGKPAIAFRPATDDVLDSHLPHAVSRQAFDAQELIAAVAEGVEAGAPKSAKTEAAKYIASQDGPLAAERVADGLARMNLSPAPPAPGASTRLHLAAGNAAATFAPLVRRFRMGPKAQAYARQKFPGITLDEVRAALAHLAEVSGRWCSVRADPMAARYCFRITGLAGG